MKNLLLISTVLFSAVSYASPYTWEQRTGRVMGSMTESKQMAYEQGIKMLETYQVKDAEQLSRTFSYMGHSFFVDRKSFTISDASVRVEEHLNKEYQIKYTPVLHIKYKYRYREPGKN